MFGASYTSPSLELRQELFSRPPVSSTMAVALEPSGQVHTLPFFVAPTRTQSICSLFLRIYAFVCDVVTLARRPPEIEVRQRMLAASCVNFDFSLPVLGHVNTLMQRPLAMPHPRGHDRRVEPTKKRGRQLVILKVCMFVSCRDTFVAQDTRQSLTFSQNTLAILAHRCCNTPSDGPMHSFHRSRASLPLHTTDPWSCHHMGRWGNHT